MKKLLLFSAMAFSGLATAQTTCAGALSITTGTHTTSAITGSNITKIAGTLPHR